MLVDTGQGEYRSQGNSIRATPSRDIGFRISIFHSFVVTGEENHFVNQLEFIFVCFNLYLIIGVQPNGKEAKMKIIC